MRFRAHDAAASDLHVVGAARQPGSPRTADMIVRVPGCMHSPLVHAAPAQGHVLRARTGKDRGKNFARSWHGLKIPLCRIARKRLPDATPARTAAQNQRKAGRVPPRKRNDLERARVFACLQKIPAFAQHGPAVEQEHELEHLVLFFAHKVVKRVAHARHQGHDAFEQRELVVAKGCAALRFLRRVRFCFARHACNFCSVGVFVFKGHVCKYLQNSNLNKLQRVADKERRIRHGIRLNLAYTFFEYGKAKVAEKVFRFVVTRRLEHSNL